MMSRRARVWTAIAAAAGLIGLVTQVIPYVLKYRLLGPYRTRVIDELDSPIAVTGWSERGLELVDGRVIQLPGMLALPRTSAALTDGTSRGIEIDERGRVYGLVRVHHWCGSDPVDEHIARVELAHLLTYFGEGEPKDQGPQRFHFPDNGSNGSFTRWGWNVSGYHAFMRVQR